MKTFLMFYLGHSERRDYTTFGYTIENNKYMAETYMEQHFIKNLV